MIARTLRTIAVLTVLMAAPIGAAISQAPATQQHTTTLRVDNDAFDFWMRPWNRPDDEYTSGVHITYSGGDAPGWSHHALSGRAACTVGATRCRTGSSEIGQDIYTPSVSLDDPHAGPNARPSAGWLYLSQRARALDVDREDDFGISLGVTGPPSLAQFTQELAHRAAPQFNRPTDWSRQINFEPGAIVTLEQRRRIAVSGGDAGFEIIPRVAASAGNVITDAEAGVEARFGWRMPHAWLPVANQGASVVFTTGVNGQAVARDLFLDGNTFTSSPRVGHKPFVGSGDAGVELRYSHYSLSYRAVSESRAYAAGPTWHPWGSLVGSVTVDR